MQTADVIIVGGGLAGLVAAIELSKARKKVLLIEKNEYPYHKVCGEYISNEVLGYLQALGFNPFAYGAASITKLRLSSPQGRNIHTQLDLGGFGISRYTMDNELYHLALKNGADILTNTRVTDIQFAADTFTATTNKGETLTSKLIIGSYGKRDTLDKKLDRSFIQKHTGYLGVKYHIKTDYPADEIGLDNFEGGYCGISKVENDTYNLCYLYKRPEKKNYKTIQELQEKVLCKNPVLKNIFTSSDFLFPEPEVINEICFAPKTLIENHIIMCGDTAGLITPLCGNGMSMAVNAARILSKLLLQSGILGGDIDANKRLMLEKAYKKEWNKNFKSRLFWGRTIQGFFGNPAVTRLFLNSIHTIPPVEKWLLSRTHGQPIM
ncbi:MAG: NAD(P)/FAD-dependent oxidoreductase [Bacteroidetes bacterium]|nr:NAD(P)/FAD-dependent oxidoreductase [Bacteroidota bacterium]